MIPAKPRILLADDYVPLLRALERLLKDQCEIVGRATTVAELLAEAQICRPDIVVADLNLPDASGIDACRRLKLAQPDIRIVLLTAEDDDPDLSAEALGAGASDFVSKSGIDRLIPVLLNLWSGIGAAQ